MNNNQIEDNEFYLVKLIFSEFVVYVFWYSGDVDGLLTLPENRQKIVAFENKADAILYAENFKLRWRDEKDEIICTDDLMNLNDCNKLLEFWNLVSDFSQTLKLKFFGDRKDKSLNTIYSKLVLGCNLPSITPAQREYVPIWSPQEKKKLVEVVNFGLSVLKQHFWQGEF